MRKLIILIPLLLLIISCLSQQQFTLIDKGLYKAAKISDSVTREDIKSGWYPIYKNDVDSVLKVLGDLDRLLKKGLKREGFTEYQTETLQFEVINIPHAYGDRYDITMTTVTPAGRYSFRISSASLKNRDNQDRIKNIYNYLKNGKLQKMM